MSTVIPVLDIQLLTACTQPIYVIYVNFVFFLKLGKCHKCAIFVQNSFNIKDSIINLVFATNTSITYLNIIIAEDRFFNHLFWVFYMYFSTRLSTFLSTSIQNLFRCLFSIAWLDPSCSSRETLGYDALITFFHLWLHVFNFHIQLASMHLQLRYLA